MIRSYLIDKVEDNKTVDRYKINRDIRKIHLDERVNISKKLLRTRR